ncbi:hypothetical protein [Cellulosimicrobium cellulans]|uniref:hypothetical protein n=1 Tax=Cellulosimicrobium cellulans TaxID=1710 RepID=UPI00130E33C9|nr:hypothetical protein [Cellulosimicrobium cellulans]
MQVAEREIRDRLAHRRLLYATAALLVLVYTLIVVGAAIGDRGASRDPVAEALQDAFVGEAAVSAPLVVSDTSSNRLLIAYCFGGLFYLSMAIFMRFVFHSTLRDHGYPEGESHSGQTTTGSQFAGRILGHAVLAVAQMLAVGATAAIALAATQQADVIPLIAKPAALFLLLFVITFATIAARGSATAARIATGDGDGPRRSLIGVFVPIATLATLVLHGSDMSMTVGSYLPFAAVVAMPLRVFVGTAAWWEPLTCVVVVTATAVLVIWRSARSYAGCTGLPDAASTSG